MAKLKCTCGNGMNNSNDPSESIVVIYNKADVDKMLEEVPEIMLIDFDTLDWDYEYWYCPECKRIHKVENIPCGKVVARFKPADNEPASLDTTEELEAYYLFSDSEMYDAEEEDTKLKDFIETSGDSHLYWVDAKDNVYIKDVDGKFKLVYIQE